MALQQRGKVWHYDFRVAGHRFRGSTKQTSESKARTYESKLIAEMERRGPSPGLKKAPTLKVFAPRFLEWVNGSRNLKLTSRRYYRSGCKVLKGTELMHMQLDRIGKEAVERLQLPAGPSMANLILRTLRRMLGKAEEWRVIAHAPRIRLVREEGREELIGPEREKALLAHLRQPIKDVFILVQDTGLRPMEVFSIEIQNIDWQRREIFNPRGKSKRSRRWVPMSDRVFNLCLVRAGDHKTGWLFPSAKSATGHIVTVSRDFAKAREAAGLPKSVVLYSARHTFGTTVMSESGNPKLVMDLMGHENLSTTMRYIHPELDQVREIINRRNRGHNAPETVN